MTASGYVSEDVLTSIIPFCSCFQVVWNLLYWRNAGNKNCTKNHFWYIFAFFWSQIGHYAKFLKGDPSLSSFNNIWRNFMQNKHYARKNGLEWLLPITRNHVVNKNKYISTKQCLWPSNLAGWWLTLKGSYLLNHIDLKTHGLVRSRDKLKTYLYHDDICGHQTWQSSNLLWESPNHSAPWSLNLMVL